MRRRSESCLSVLLSLLLFLPAPLLAQMTTGTLEGRVTDQSGAVLPGVTVTISGPIGSRATTTGADGMFRFLAVMPGRYQITVELTGFATKQARVSVGVGKSASVAFVLEVGVQSEVITVVAASEGVTVNTATQAVAASGCYGCIRMPSGRFSTATFGKVDESPFVKVKDSPRSTFSADVDTASYSIVRRYLNDGELPPPDAVRIEEMLNYFSYDYPEPEQDAPFSVTTEVADCPWSAGHRLLQIGLRARSLGHATPARNLVFLMDVSGSMTPAERLPLLRSAMSLLAERLTARDTVAIVVYAGASGLALPATRGDDHETILRALADLRPGGSTNGAEGIELAYRIAEQHFVTDGVNRVILATDGDFNVGITSPGDLVRLIEKEREKGIFLSVLGVGDDNLKDATMSSLADRGNGNYAYIDSLEEARKVLVAEADATLVTVAKDVKLQVEFNPKAVLEYRLIGYEKRKLDEQDFKDDRKDAGEIGAGHTVTVLYEVVPAGQPAAEARDVDPLRYQEARRLAAAAGSGELATVALRYKKPAGGKSLPLSVSVRDPGPGALPMPANLGFAAAVVEYGLLLRGSEHKGGASFEQARELVRRHAGADPSGLRQQLGTLLDLADGLMQAKSASR